jgi:hypothetical protein
MNKYIKDLIDAPLPADIEAEKAVLGAVLLQPDLFAGLILTEDDFHDAAHRLIYRAMLQMYGDGKPLDPVLVARLLKSGHEQKETNWLYTLQELARGCGPVAHLPHYARVVKDMAIRRRLWHRSVETIQHVHNGVSTADLVAHVETISEITLRECQSGIVPRTCADIARHPARLRMPIIEGLQREGETINVIAPSKTGKSWLALGLGLSVASGRDWLGYPVNPGPVLYIDNELHAETFEFRVQTVAAAMGLRLEDLEGFAWYNLRGQLVDLPTLAHKLHPIAPGTYRLIILDAWYRFVPKGYNENDNAQMTELHNRLDALAEQLKCGFACIDHSSKGNQSNKAQTDVGAGAGAKARAVDSHVTLRAHEENDCYVLEAGARSFKKIDPVGVRFKFPLWRIDKSLDPTALRPDNPRRRKAGTVKPLDPWTAERFTSAFVTAAPRVKSSIIDDAVVAGLSKTKAGDLLKSAESKNLVHRWTYGPRKPVEFATVQQPSLVP